MSVSDISHKSVKIKKKTFFKLTIQVLIFLLLITIVLVFNPIYKAFTSGVTITHVQNSLLHMTTLSSTVPSKTLSFANVKSGDLVICSFYAQNTVLGTTFPIAITDTMSDTWQSWTNISDPSKYEFTYYTIHSGSSSGPLNITLTATNFSAYTYVAASCDQFSGTNTWNMDIQAPLNANTTGGGSFTGLYGSNWTPVMDPTYGGELLYAAGDDYSSPALTSINTVSSITTNNLADGTTTPLSIGGEPGLDGHNLTNEQGVFSSYALSADSYSQTLTGTATESLYRGSSPLPLYGGVGYITYGPPPPTPTPSLAPIVGEEITHIQGRAGVVHTNASTVATLGSSFSNVLQNDLLICNIVAYNVASTLPNAATTPSTAVITDSNNTWTKSSASSPSTGNYIFYTVATKNVSPYNFTISLNHPGILGIACDQFRGTSSWNIETAINTSNQNVKSLYIPAQFNTVSPSSNDFLYAGGSSPLSAGPPSTGGTAGGVYLDLGSKSLNALGGAVFSEYTPTTNSGAQSIVTTVGGSGWSGGALYINPNGQSVSGLNFWLSSISAKPWWQTVGLDTRFNGGINDMIPPSATCINSSGSQSPNNYLTIPSLSTTQPGIVISGNGVGSINLGSGQASANSWNWLTYNEPDTNSVNTSFSSLYANIKNSGASNITFIDEANNPYCSYNSVTKITSCTFNSTNIPNSSIFLIDPCKTSTLTTYSYTVSSCSDTVTMNFINPIPLDNNYIFLVNGNMDVLSKIQVPTSATAMFSSSGNITVDPSVGESTPSTSCTPPNPGSADLEGIYSADNNFIVSSNANCNASPAQPDLQLLVGGSITANAENIGGSFQMNRTLCSNDTTTPAFSISTRPDFALNAPELFKSTNNIYSEIGL